MADFPCIVRGSNGDFMACANASHFYVQFAEMAEILGFRWAIGMDIDLGFKFTCFETDCLRLFESWKKKKKQDNSYFSTVLHDCRNLDSYFDNLIVFLLCLSSKLAIALLIS